MKSELSAANQQQAFGITILLLVLIISPVIIFLVGTALHKAEQDEKSDGWGLTWFISRPTLYTVCFIKPYRDPVYKFTGSR